VAIQILDLTRDPNVSIKEIGKVVENDQAIAAKVLRTINSSYYGLASPCPNIQRALGYLGLNTVRSLVLGFSLVDSFRNSSGNGGFDLRTHWRRALYGATSARTTANRAIRIDPDEAFIASMLQDVGMLAASMALGDEYTDAVAEADGDHFGVERIEKERFGFTHSEAGARLAERWRLPRCMSESVRFHHDPENAPDEHRDLVRMVSLSTIAAESLTVESPRLLVNRFRTLGRDWFDLPVDGAEELLKAISKGASELSRLFQLDTGHKPDVGQIMAQAQDQQIATQISMERERQSLETAASEMEKQSLTDGLTGIANRKRFDAVLERCFADACDDGSVAVLFMDADRFKSVNDTHGHPAGDAILIELARRITDAIGEAGTAFRYGGEEFVVIAPNTDRIAGARIAETIRKAIEAAPFDLRKVPGCIDELPITISLGVAAVDDSSRGFFTEPATLLKAADMAVYAAKQGGRNCTRVYNSGKSKQAQQAATTSGSDEPMNGSNRSEGGRTPQRVVAQPTINVLLIENDPMQQSLLKAVIAGFDHVDVCAVPSGEEALAMLGLEGESCGLTGLVPGIILCDLALPGFSGLDLIRRIRTSPNHGSVPLIVLGDSDSPDQARACIAAGANAFMPKQRIASNPEAMLGNLIGFWTSALVAA
jgi:diguanylate cyclase (GGDEF)-like protein